MQRLAFLHPLQIVDLLVKFLQLSTDQLAGSPANLSGSDHLLRRLCVESYGVLETYLMGNSRKNELYFSRFFDFFRKQFGQDVSASHVLRSNLLFHLQTTVKKTETRTSLFSKCRLSFAIYL